MGIKEKRNIILAQVFCACQQVLSKNSFGLRAGEAVLVDIAQGVFFTDNYDFYFGYKAEPPILPKHWENR
jgi:hypothetical protein